jgi:gliding motility-associated-like protein
MFSQNYRTSGNLADKWNEPDTDIWISVFNYRHFKDYPDIQVQFFFYFPDQTGHWGFFLFYLSTGKFYLQRKLHHGTALCHQYPPSRIHNNSAGHINHGLKISNLLLTLLITLTAIANQFIVHQLNPIFRNLFCLFSLLVVHYSAFAQPNPTAGPAISYPTPRIYSKNIPIDALSPTNTGGQIPEIPYANVTTFAGSATNVVGSTDGLGTAARFNKPAGLGSDRNGNIYVADGFNNTIRKISPDGRVTTIAGILAGGHADGPALNAKFNRPWGVLLDNTGNILYVADKDNHVIRKIDPAGNVSTIAGTVRTEGATNANGTAAKFFSPENMVFDNDGNMYIADTDNHLIRKMTPAGEVSTFAGSGAPGKINATGTAASFNKPIGLVLNSHTGDIYVAEYGNHLIRKITPDGRVSTFAGNGLLGNANGTGESASFDRPYGLTIDHLDNLYLSDANDVIKKITPAGKVYTIAGTKRIIPGFNDGLAFEAGFYTPIGLTFDNNSNLYVADENNNKIRKISLGGGYFTDKPLPAGLELNPSTGLITGTPTEASPATDYTIIGHNYFGESSFVMNIEVKETVEPLVQISPLTADICTGSTITFTATAENAGASPFFQWKVNGIDAGENSVEFRSTDFQNGDKITCVVSNTGYTPPLNSAPSNEVVITVRPLATLDVSISADQNGQICAGTRVNFNAFSYSNSITAPRYEWSVNGQSTGVVGTSYSSASLRDGDQLTCTVTAPGDCVVNPSVVSNTITISFLPEILCGVRPPNAFSPNNDGSNDTWIIPALLNYPDCTIQIFNRSGEPVFSANGYAKPWDGIYMGKPLPVGTYYYVIGLTPDFKKLSGAVTILR